MRKQWILFICGALACTGCQKEDQSTYTPLLDFANSPAGWQPWGSLTAVNDWLYGCTTFGGAAEYGTLFKIHKDGSHYQTIHSFGASAADGRTPHYRSLQQHRNWLYGATTEGGFSNLGTFFRFDTETGEYEPLHSFTGGKQDGAAPHSHPTIANNTLYGMTQLGGAHNLGTLFSLSLDGAHSFLLHSFNKREGSEPLGFVIEDRGFLYGMTGQGGAYGRGVLFRYSLTSKTYSVLHAFQDQSGAFPAHGGLTLVNDRLYGLTSMGGKEGLGVLFSLHRDGEDYQVLHHFSGAPKEGAHPKGSLTLFNHQLYGLTYSGGPQGLGGLFAYSLDTKEMQWLHFFTGPLEDGSFPEDNITVLDGKIYGMTKEGGHTLSAPSTDPAYSNGILFLQPLSP